MDRNKAMQIIQDNEGHLTPDVCADLWLTWSPWEWHEPLTEGNPNKIIAAIVLAMKDQDPASYALCGKTIADECARYIRDTHRDDADELRDAA